MFNAYLFLHNPIEEKFTALVYQNRNNINYPNAIPTIFKGLCIGKFNDILI